MNAEILDAQFVIVVVLQVAEATLCLVSAGDCEVKKKGWTYVLVPAHLGSFATIGLYTREIDPQVAYRVPKPKTEFI
jgi:hypothetical protein